MRPEDSVLLPPLCRVPLPSQGATGHGHLSTARQGTEAAEEPEPVSGLKLHTDPFCLVQRKEMKQTAPGLPTAELWERRP